MRSAKDVIDDAIRDNRKSEWFLYSCAIAFIVVGVFVLIWGTIKGATITSIAGVISSSLCLPAFNSARQIRKENLVIRLLEAPLSHAPTATEAAEMLARLADAILRDTPRNTVADEKNTDV